MKKFIVRVRNDQTIHEYTGIHGGIWTAILKGFWYFFWKAKEQNNYNNPHLAHIVVEAYQVKQFEDSPDWEVIQLQRIDRREIR